jgi:hypothetical protein
MGGRPDKVRAVKAVPLIVVAAVVTALSGIALANPVATESGKRVELIANCFKPKFKPGTVIIACDDASLGAKAMTWQTWTRKKADGTGTGLINDCNPDCASGTTKTAPMELQLSKPQLCSNGKRVFAKLRFIWTSGPPISDAVASGSVPIGCKLAAL